MSTLLARWGMAVSIFLLAGPAWGDEGFDAALKKASLDYEARLREATENLVAVRAKLAGEKAPLLDQMRAAQDRIIAAESETRRMRITQENAGETRRRLLKQIDDARKNSSYANTLAHDSLKALDERLSPGEDGAFSERMQSLRERLETGAGGAVAADVAQFMLDYTRRSLGGHARTGTAILNETNRVVEGTFAFLGPETFFLPASDDARPAVVRSREGATNPIAFEMAEWRRADAEPVFKGQVGRIPADATGGKALRLKETRGTIWQHIDTGGVVAYAIVVVGVVSLLMILQKMRDVARMVVDGPAAVQAFLGALASGAPADAERALEALHGSTRELFATGLRHRTEPKTILEEHLESVLLEQRLFYERRLPLLAVIATAAPLMGLLGTVVGMVKTFALITVFGTGNAAKLSSGISEVLVATELGLIVAIPTLVAHGFLAHRIHKKLAQLERYALQFLTAAETAKVRRHPDARDPMPT